MMKHPLTAREAAWTAFTPLELATQLRGEEEKRRIPITGLGSGTVGGGGHRHHALPPWTIELILLFM